MRPEEIRCVPFHLCYDQRVVPSSNGVSYFRLYTYLLSNMLQELYFYITNIFHINFHTKLWFVFKSFHCDMLPSFFLFGLFLNWIQGCINLLVQVLPWKYKLLVIKYVNWFFLPDSFVRFFPLLGFKYFWFFILLLYLFSYHCWLIRSFVLNIYSNRSQV